MRLVRTLLLVVVVVSMLGIGWGLWKSQREESPIDAVQHKAAAARVEVGDTLRSLLDWAARR